jgi:hypothetical protein
MHWSPEVLPAGRQKRADGESSLRDRDDDLWLEVDLLRPGENSLPDGVKSHRARENSLWQGVDPLRPGENALSDGVNPEPGIPIRLRSS